VDRSSRWPNHATTGPKRTGSSRIKARTAVGTFSVTLVYVPSATTMRKSGMDAAKGGLAQVGLAEVGIVQLRVRQVCADQDRSVQIGLFQVRSGQVCAGQILAR
jgi:hypothetical protein